MQVQIISNQKTIQFNIGEMKNPNDHVREYVKNRLIDYIKAKQNFNLEWVKRKIRNAGLKRADLSNIFIELKDYMNNDRFLTIFNTCQDVKFDCEEIK
jgi:hypothetical protein